MLGEAQSDGLPVTMMKNSQLRGPLALLGYQHVFAWTPSINCLASRFALHSQNSDIMTCSSVPYDTKISRKNQVEMSLSTHVQSC